MYNVTITYVIFKMDGKVSLNIKVSKDYVDIYGAWENNFNFLRPTKNRLF